MVEVNAKKFQVGKLFYPIQGNKLIIIKIEFRYKMIAWSNLINNSNWLANDDNCAKLWLFYVLYVRKVLAHHLDKIYSYYYKLYRNEY